jgi:Domain of unknown function (DUF1918)
MEAERIWVDRHAVGGRKRQGEIVEVLGEPGHVRYRVRWEDGRETIVSPGSDASLSLPGREGEVRPRPRAKTPAKTPGPSRPQDQVEARLTAKPGDRLVVRAHHIREPERDAQILEVLGPNGTPPYRVRWTETGREGLLFPGPDAFVEHPAGPAKRARRQRPGAHKARRGR